jgi:adenosine deaminase
MTAPSRQAVEALPKVDLHCHVDGAARPQTLLDLARDGGVSLPADDLDGLLPHVQATDACRSLRDFLQVFEAFYPVLSVPGAMRRVARELVEDAAADGVVHLEARFCPALQAGPDQTSAQVLDDILEGLAEGSAATGTSTGAIVCCYRPLSLEVNEELVDLALAGADRGVVAMDLAGPEDLPGAPFAAALARAREGGLPLTIHAGEAAGPESITEALDLLATTRIGHGVALREDATLAERVREAGVAIECCLTSNLQTGAVASLDQHPFPRLREAGHLVTLNTDDPAVSGITLSGELLLAVQAFGLGWEDLLALQRASAQAAFLDEAGREALLARLTPTG